ncbi:flagellar biosynthesis protein FliR [Gordoniibacillus kamchatkensis]|uniref:Flagellar biosynthetic protein FliR n=1 Tax=Gordoniibacillus kamchatkensis TaxID=1590651 RepID=A0ABR5AEI5_9BACL|nr:flagellar biosynthetic protein FliR [Paenibacillus sp. VKM B-2647]KIL39233.1 flagellar biosynthesis protein FliR [Paenibacillus sp. VKM B-2647]
MEQVLAYLPAMLLVLCRVSAFFVVAPVFSYRTVPNTFKIGLSVFVALLTFMAVGTKTVVHFDLTYILLVIREMMVGMLLAFLATLFFSVVQIAGSFMDIQIGFGIANVIDPMTGASSPMLGNFKFMVAIMLFLAFDGHHYFLQAIMNSYSWVPIDNDLFGKIAGGSVSDFLVRSFITMFTIAFQMSLPVLAAMFLTDVSLGLLTRVAPQFNIFVVGVPIKILIGLAVLIILFPSFVSLYRDLFSAMFGSMQQLLQLLAGTA